MALEALSSSKASIGTRERVVVGETSPFGRDCVGHGDHEPTV
jgi:hypothetical protein